jgi:hypothetical protein
MTDDMIRQAYARGVGRELQDHLLPDARSFIAAVFDTLPPAGYTDGTTIVEDQWMLDGSQPIWRKP